MFYFSQHNPLSSDLEVPEDTCKQTTLKRDPAALVVID